MKWKHTEVLFNKYWNTLINDPPVKIDYDSFVDAMLGDLHMIINPRSVIENESDFIQFTYTYFPKDSEAFQWTKKIISLKYYGNDKNEFIACFKRDDIKRSNLLYRQRAEIEYNPEYIQLVAMAVPYIIEQDIPIFVFIQESKSDMAGHTTMIGGHVRYSGNDQVSWLDNQCITTAMREAVEEMGVNPNHLKYSPNEFPYKDYLQGNNLGYVTFDTTSKELDTSISYYHIGRCYPFLFSKSGTFEAKLEDGKEFLLYSSKHVSDTIDIRNRFNKKIQVYTPETFDYDVFKPDDWLTQFLRNLK